MNRFLKDKSRRVGVITVAVGIVVLVTSILLSGCNNSSQSALGSPNDAFTPVVVITLEATLTPEPTPVPEIIATTEVEVITPTATPEPDTTPPMDLNAMPVRQCNGCLNILLLGLDQRPSEDPNRAATDTIVVLSLDTATRTAGMLSLPRDLFVPMPNSDKLGRINTAMAIGGPRYAMQTVEYNTGIQTQHYIRVNFNAVSSLVDLVGGIDVNVDQDINDPTYPDMHYGYDPFVISKGMHHMDGATALKYARTRHGASDFYRMRRQQQIMLAIRDRVLSSNAIPQLLPKAPEIFSTLSSSIATDLGLTDIINLIMLAKDITPDKITRLTVDEHSTQDWVTPSGGDVLIPLRDHINALAAQLYNQALPVMKVTIQNGSPTKGLAESTQAFLQSKGYTIVGAKDAQAQYTNTVIYDYYGSNQFSQNLALTLGLPKTVVTSTVGTSNDVDVLVVLGEDYKPKQ
jgi:polyisoprenyl-teichoic acid--peptidoglycan teichoic acid transferase